MLELSQRRGPGGVVSTPTVSIVTPTYNHPESLAACIASVVSQSFVDWEQIVVDDGSEIPAQEIAARIGDNRIRVIRQNHVGILRLADTYNSALRIAKGRCIAILEDDDLWPQDKLSLQVPGLDEDGVVLSWGRAQLVDETGTYLGTLPYGGESLPRDVCTNTPPGRALSFLLRRNIIPACTVIVQRSALERIGGFKGLDLPYVDYPTWLSLALHGRFHFCPEICGVWRIHPSQTSSTRAVEQQQTAAELALEFFDELPEAQRLALGFSRNALIASGADRVAQAYFWRGRFQATAGKRSSAREDFLAAAARGMTRTRAKALLALAGLALGIDIERIVRFFGRLPIRAGKDSRI